MSMVPQKTISNKGLLFALLIITCWSICIAFLMSWKVSFINPFTYLFVLMQMHLYTGLFITAHDAMHGTVSSNKILNNLTGIVCSFLYAAFWYPYLYKKHHQHHTHVHTENDPDYHNGNFFAWYYRFMRNYLSLWQVIIMAIMYNILKLYIPEPNLLLFWIAPSLLSTLQLFYFGTYLPHKGEHTNKYFARSQKRNHLLAFWSCYFFGYHYEHHHSPHVPWWKLWTTLPPQKTK